MGRIVRTLVAALILGGAASCGAAPRGPGPAAPPSGLHAGAASPARHAATCPPGSIHDGHRCRMQRGIIIDQRQPWPLSWLALLFQPGPAE